MSDKEYLLDWDSEIHEDQKEFVVLPEGEYDFVVMDVERQRHNGSAKLPPCNKAVVHLRFDEPEGVTIVKNNFFLHSRCEGQISAFYISIGLKKRGEPTRMNWTAVKGLRGRAKLGIRTYTGNDGNEYTTNEIKSFVEPKAQPQQSWQSGTF